MKPAQLPCFMVEERLFNREFFGRENTLKQLDEVLIPDYDLANRSNTGYARPSQLTLCGQGGLGKSEIAIHFAFTRRKHFDAIFWVRADDPGKLEADFGTIASRLGLEDPARCKDPIVSRDIAKSWLANPKKLVRTESDVDGQTEASWLIIFDNADDSTILEEYWPIFGSGSILVTSRDPSAKTRLGTLGASIDLQPFDEEAGAALFRKLSNRDEEEELSREISRELGGLPLAIAQMAGIVRYQQLEFAEFLGRYRDWSARSDLYSYSVGGRLKLRRGTVASVFALDHLDEEAQSLIQLCSVMDPDCIQESLFADWAFIRTKLNCFPGSSFRYTTARTELLRCSLIQRNEKSKEFSLHRLVQDAVKATLTPSHRKLLLECATDLLAIAWGTTEIHRRHIKGRWQDREELYPHILNLKLLYEAWKSEIGWAGADVAALLSEAGWFKHERGNQPICKSFCEAAEAIIDHEQPDLQHTENVDDHRFDLLCDLLYALGALANESNDGLSCMKHNEQFLLMRQRAAVVRGRSDVRLALSYNQYGVACMMAGETEKAIDSFHKSIHTYRSLEKIYEKGIDSNPLLNVGFAYWLKGDLERSLGILTEGLKDRESVYGYMDSVSYHTGRFWHALGNVKLDKGLPVQSEECHKKALAQYHSSIGEYHHKTADVCHRVAQHCLWREDFDNAKVLIEQALKAWNMQAASYGPEIARTTFLKSKLAGLLGDQVNADKLRGEAAELRARIATALPKAVHELQEEDFDELVTFWSR